jgi:ribonuclease P protein component
MAFENAWQLKVAEKFSPVAGLGDANGSPLSLPPNKFPRTQRLLSHADYRVFRQSSKKQVLSSCVVYVRANGKTVPRLGITIRARATAVARNRVKRAIREFFRTSGWPQPGFDYNFVIPRERDLSFPYSEELKRSLRQELLK